MDTTQPLTRPATCRRCAGTGTFQTARGIGPCFRCFGAGQVETDKAALRATQERIDRQRAVAAAARAWVLTLPRRSDAACGLELLQANEPERYLRACESIAAGHPAVEGALAAYWIANR